MYQVIRQEDNKIGFTLEGALTANEFQQVIHQLESLCTMYPHIHVLFDAMTLEKYDFKILLDEFDFYKKYKNHLNRIALVSDKRFATFLLGQFNKLTQTEFKSFDTSQIDEATKWVFPSRLP